LVAGRKKKNTKKREERRNALAHCCAGFSPSRVWAQDGKKKGEKGEKEGKQEATHEGGGCAEIRMGRVGGVINKPQKKATTKRGFGGGVSKGGEKDARRWPGQAFAVAVQRIVVRWCREMAVGG